MSKEHPLSKNLKKMRIKKGLSQDRLAKLADVALQYVNYFATITMIVQYIFLVKILGSFSVVCAWEGRASTTPFQVAHFALRNTKNKTIPKKTSNQAKPKKQKGKKEGGLGE